MPNKMKLKINVLKKYDKDGVNFITVDGITCSGKSLFANLLRKKLSRKFKNILVLSKDLFLFTREKRIRFTKKIKKDFLNQNKIHYDLNKLNRLVKFLHKGNGEGKLILRNLYNRKTGKNNLTVKFKFLNNRLIIFEGIFVNEDIKNLVKPVRKILIIEKVYESLARKIERIRDKKISIQHVVTEFTRIHLQSFNKHLLKNNFDVVFRDEKRDFIPIYSGKKKQLDYIKVFLSKHLY